MKLPSSKVTSDQLPPDSDELRELLVDVFGQHLMSIRNQRFEAISQCVADPERAGRGKLQREEFERVAALDESAQEAALELAQKGIDLFIGDLLALLGHQGYTLEMDREHCLRYNLVLQVLQNQVPGDAEEMEYGVQQHEVSLNQGSTANFLGDYLGQWRNRHASHVSRLGE